MGTRYNQPNTVAVVFDPDGGEHPCYDVTDERYDTEPRYWCAGMVMRSVQDLPDYDRRACEVRDGVDALGPHLVCNDERETGEGRLEFSWQSCDACGSSLGGERMRFATLGEEITP